MTDVRELHTDEDIENVIAMARAFHAEYGSPASFEADCITAFCNNLRKDFDRETFNVFVAYRGDDPVGFLVCRAEPYYFSSQIIASQDLWYVVPALRSTRIAFDLIRSFEEWARLRGAIEIVTGVMSADPVKGKKISRVLTRMGYPRMGSFHRRVTFNG